MKAIIHVGKDNPNANKFIEDNSRSVLANYGQSILAEVDEQDMETIKNDGYRIRQIDDSPEIEMSGFKINTRAPQLSLSESSATIPENSGKGYYIMQLIGPMHSEWQKSLQDMNVTLYQQVTNSNHYLIGVDNTKLPQMFQTGFVQSIIPYYPELKINPALVNTGIHSNIDKDILNKPGIEAMAIRSENIRDGKIDKEENPQSTLKLNRYPSEEKTQLDVVLFDKEQNEQLRKALNELEIKTVQEYESHFIIEMNLEDTEKLKKLIDLPFVRRIDEFSPNRLFNEIAEGIIKLSIFRNNHHLQGENQTIAIADTGLDTGDAQNLLPDFMGRIKGIQPFGRTNPPDASDLNGHGTHVAGSVLGDGSSTNGLIKGMAPKSQLVFQSLLNNQGGLSTGSLPNLYKKAMDLGAVIHTNSWGASCQEMNGVMVCPMAAQYDTQASDTDKFMFQHREFLILFAAGNEGDQISPFNRFVSPPGTAKNVLTVGATKSKRALPTGSIQLDLTNSAGNFVKINNIDLEANEIGDIAAFSSIGPVKHNRIKPDIVAPGTWILSTRSTVCEEDWITSERVTHDKSVGYGLPGGPVFGHGNKNLPTPDNFEPSFKEKCMYSSGTSMATPIVAGACAIVRQFMTDVLGIIPSAALIKAFVINGAFDLRKPTKQQGWGRIDLENTLQSNDFVKFDDSLENAIGTGDINTYKVTPKSLDKPMTVTLTWRDPPGDTIQNQLILRIIHQQSGTVFTSEDDTNILNNVQKIVISNPKSGGYKIEIEGINITRGIPEVQSPLRQDYALVVSNCNNMELV